MTALRFIIESSRPFWGWILALLVVSLFAASEVSITPLLLRKIINTLSEIDPEKAWRAVAFWVALFLLVSVAITLLWRAYEYCWMHLNNGQKKYLGITLMRRLMQQSHQFFLETQGGNLASKLSDLMSALPDFINQLLSELVRLLAAGGIAVLSIWMVSPKYGLLLLIWLLLFLSCSIWMTIHGKAVVMLAAEKKAGTIGLIVDILTNILNVRLFARRSREDRALLNALEGKREAEMKRDRFFMYANSFLGSSFTFYQITCVVSMISDFTVGRILVGDLVMLLTLNLGLITVLWSFSQELGKLTEKYGTIKQALLTLQAPISLKDHPGATTLSVTRGEICFDNVCFCYRGHNELFSRKNITIFSKQKVGLVGYSGSGKTTFVNLILRLYDTTEGKITIDGQEIQKVTQDSLHQVIALIPQDPILFHRSIRENILYGREEADQGALLEAAQRAHVDSFVQGLPDGYETVVGERGIKLSGGQRQRIAIARAILKDAPILILDEATSQLDSVTEGEIQASLTDLMASRTTIVIAHRLSTLAQMDRILVFDGGKIIQDGTASQLLSQEGLFKTLWQMQSTGFLPN